MINSNKKEERYCKKHQWNGEPQEIEGEWCFVCNKCPQLIPLHKMDKPAWENEEKGGRGEDSWSEEFDELFIKITATNPKNKDDVEVSEVLQALYDHAYQKHKEAIKKFIKSKFSSQKARYIKRIKSLEKDVRPEIKIWLSGDRETNEAYNKGLEDSINSLNEEI